LNKNFPYLEIDPERLMKTEGGEILIVETHSNPLERKFIPCLVTNSKLTPTLYNGNHSYIDGTEVTYNPTANFLISNKYIQGVSQQNPTSPPRGVHWYK
jgi:hypothetical protein